MIGYWREVPKYRHWSIGAIECYKRGCNCQGCPTKELVQHQKCRMKEAVISLYSQFGPPMGVEELIGNKFLLNENERQTGETNMYDKDLDLEYANYLEPLVKAVKKGYTTLKEISEETGINTQRLSVDFADMYRNHLNKFTDKGDKSAREAVCDFIRERLIDKHNAKKQEEKKDIPLGVKPKEDKPKPTEYKINDKLTEQEETVKNLLLDGLSYEQISQKLVLSMATVKTHVSSIFSKRDYHSLQELLCTEYRIRQKELENRIADLESRPEPGVFNFSGLRLRIQDEIEKLNTKLKAIDEFEELVNW